MNKSELIKALSDKTNYTEVATKQFLDAFIDVVQKQVAKGDTVSIIGFGSFENRLRAGRYYKGFDGKMIKTKKTVVPYFKAGKIFKDIVKGNKARKK